MNNSKALFQKFVNQITTKESQEEIQSIGYIVFQKFFNLSMTDLLADKSISYSKEIEKSFDDIITRLNKNEPLQYILGEAEFYGHKFYVNSSVLIPRPETEDLVRVIITSVKDKTRLSILDIGTGSGCIPIMLALELNGAKVYATDVSDMALTVAKNNAIKLEADVTFIKHDILHDPLPYSDLDIITSNPPYVTLQEQNTIHENVKNYEPHLALFVPDHDPLLFYKAIVRQARKTLKQNGLLLVEINANYAEEVKQLFLTHGFIQTQIIKDLSGKDRIVKGVLSSDEFNN